MGGLGNLAHKNVPFLRVGSSIMSARLGLSQNADTADPGGGVSVEMLTLLVLGGRGVGKLGQGVQTDRQTNGTQLSIANVSNTD